ncbi:hypothetical protein EVAR_64322_1 [Eumeta japonica]|uniref:Uncharacterized protein n=1 Tax=Eumeta variegata TaxID=151549 RepID=A0A4C1ZCX0_EUMVA|nr:hypothetical protein EVAR_64322_1 [Eumeta japonica]
MKPWRNVVREPEKVSNKMTKETSVCLRFRSRICTAKSNINQASRELITERNWVRTNKGVARRTPGPPEYPLYLRTRT